MDYTALAHASKLVAPGAYRVESNTFGEGSLEDVAFRNPDGTLVLLVLNTGGSIAHFNIGWAGKYAVYELPGGAVATFRWKILPASRSSLQLYSNESNELKSFELHAPTEERSM